MQVTEKATRYSQFEVTQEVTAEGLAARARAYIEQAVPLLRRADQESRIRAAQLLETAAATLRAKVARRTVVKLRQCHICYDNTAHACGVCEVLVCSKCRLEHEDRFHLL